MSYNNIGLTTPRGSGTSGYVQRNLSHTRRTQDTAAGGGAQQNYRDQPMAAPRQPDQSILDHERKRQVENQCLELAAELEDQQDPTLDPLQIQERVNTLRAKLLAESAAASSSLGTRKTHGFSARPRETHEIAAMKLEENEKFRKALRVRGTYEEGQAFDREYQASRKALALDARAARDELARTSAPAPGPHPRNHHNRSREKPYQKPA